MYISNYLTSYKTMQYSNYTMCFTIFCVVFYKYCLLDKLSSFLALSSEVDTRPTLQQADIQPYVTGSLFKDKLFFHNDVAGNRASKGKSQVECDVFITMRH